MGRVASRSEVRGRWAVLLAAAALAVAAVPGPALAASSGNSARTKVIVTFAPGHRPAAKAAARAAGGNIGYSYHVINGFSATMPAGALNALRRNKHVVSVERDGRLELLDTPTGDLEYDNAWGVRHIGAYPVHQAGIRGQGVKVAVIDTGIDYIHDRPSAQEPPVVDPEFNGTYQGGYDFVNNDANPMDDNGHGTHVAGILAADHNGYLVVGVAPGVKLWGLKVLGASGSGDYSGLIAALDWSVTNHMDVVNISLGGHDVSAALATAVHNASVAGVTIVAAAGNVVTLNDLIYGCPVAYPAAYPEAIAVTYTGQNDALTGYSCTGPQVDIAAPGDQIFSPVPIGPCQNCSTNGYLALSGTSMASPHVAGAVALVLSKGIADANHDGLLSDDVKAHLCATARTASSPAKTDARYPNWYGCGIVNVQDALLINPPPPPDNGAPIAAPDSAATAEDSSVDIPVLANDSDPNGDTLTLTAAGAPSHGSTASQPNGTVRYSPAANYAGPDSFDYTVDDGGGHSATGTVSVTVTPVNDTPVATDDALVTSRDVPSTIAVLANDTDVDGDALLVTGVTAPASGTATANADGTITYTPAANFAGTDGFDYTVGDGAGGSDTGHVAVTVLAVNHPPVAVDDTLTAPEDTPTTMDAAANDTDLDGGALSVSAVGPASHGTTSITASGQVRYAPAANYNGGDGFDYTVADGAGATDTGHVTVTVTPGNDPPVAVADAVTTPEDTPVTFVPAANDTDIDGDALAVTAIGSPAAGTAVLNANGTVTYTPLADVNGTDAFDYTVSDGAGGSATGTITVTISAVNDPPSAAAKTVTTNYQTATSITLTGADTETCDLAFTIVSQPAHGKLGSIGNKLCVTLLPPYSDGATVTYTPNAGYSGPDSFTYRTSDGQLTSSPATVSITVKPAVELHIGDLDGSRTLQSTTWTAKVVLRVDNASHAAVSGVTVSGSWSAGGTASCKTASNGTCSVSKAKLPNLMTSVTFSVTGMTYATGAYVPASNHDPDGDSNGTAVVITR